jgi:ribonucleoside-triphosphate reductase (thioredoxin)
MLDNVIHFNGDRDARDMMSEAKFFEAYSRWDDKKDRYETWNDAVERVMNMHRDFYKDVMTEELSQLIDEAEAAYKDKLVLGAQRALQFGGEQLLRHQMRLYNCTSSYADRKEFFGEFFYILLCGAGAGVSVQKHHVAKLPKIQNRTKQAKIHQITDDIEGWATAADVLMSSYFIGGGKYPEYEGRRVYFDTSLIREKGSMISGGFKAPGPEPLRKALDKIEHLLQGLVLSGENTLRPIHVYDISMHLADAVLAGGVRRSATIFLFSPDDEEMMTAKTGDWYLKNPQRARSNNSALIVRSEATREYFSKIIESVKQFGEPGFVFADSKDHCVNPCVEIGMFPQYNGISGWQGCNLTELNGSMCNDIEAFIRACRSGAILGTLQAGYTDFKFVSDITKKIFDREALLGVSITGWMNNPQVLLDEENLKLGATLVKQINRQVANLIGILPAARTTCVKPSGNASVLLKTASGVHGEHAPLYIRNVQMNKDSEVAQLIKQTNPYMVEESVWSQNKTDYVISFPVIAPKNSIFRDELYGTNLLDKVKLIQQNWVEYGTDVLTSDSESVIVVHDRAKDTVMDYYEAVIHRFGGDVLLNSARAEMDGSFSIVAQTQDYFVLTDGKKNVKFGRKNGRVLERFDLVTRKELRRKAVAVG